MVIFYSILSRHQYPISISSNLTLNTHFHIDNDQVNDYISRLTHTFTSGSLPYCDARVASINSSLDSRTSYAKHRLLESDSGLDFLSHQRTARQIYNSLALSIDDLRKLQVECSGFHFYPLQSEPEMTTVPAAGPSLVSQLDIVHHIVSQISHDEVLILKEHPHQWKLHHINDGDHYLRHPSAYKSHQFYNLISFYPNVVLCDSNLPATTLLDEFSPSVWSATGSILLEAWLRNLPIHSMGDVSPWKDLSLLSSDLSLDRFNLLRDYLATHLISPDLSSSAKFLQNISDI